MAGRTSISPSKPVFSLTSPALPSPFVEVSILPTVIPKSAMSAIFPPLPEPSVTFEAIASVEILPKALILIFSAAASEEVEIFTRLYQFWVDDIMCIAQALI